MRTGFEFIEPRSGSTSYPTLVRRPRGRKMKGKGKKVIIPLKPRYGIPWEEPNNDDAYV